MRLCKSILINKYIHFSYSIFAINLNKNYLDFQFQSPRMTGDNTTAQPGKKSKKQKLPSIWNVIVKVFGPYYMIGGLNNLMYVLVTFLGPQLLK